MDKKQIVITTPLGPIIAVADDRALYALEFTDHGKYPMGRTKAIDLLEKELDRYFAGNLKAFETKVHLEGTPFQMAVWEELKNIPFGQTKSYAELAKAIHKPTAFRAVANALGANKLPIILPCHRVINANGELGGYNGGTLRKKWLLNHE